MCTGSSSRWATFAKICSCRVEAAGRLDGSEFESCEQRAVGGGEREAGHPGSPVCIVVPHSRRPRPQKLGHAL